MTLPQFDPEAEFDQQLGTLLKKGYPAMSGKTDDEFTELVARFGKPPSCIPHPRLRRLGRARRSSW